jgi:exodeoxyribonuclease VII small subunit
MTTPKKPSSRQARSFQERLAALTNLVEDLEQGELSLEDAIARFEEGQKLHRGLLDELGAYEKRVERIVRDTEGRDRLEPDPDPVDEVRDED